MGGIFNPAYIGWINMPKSKKDIIEFRNVPQTNIKCEVCKYPADVTSICCNKSYCLTDYLKTHIVMRKINIPNVKPNAR